MTRLSQFLSLLFLFSLLVGCSSLVYTPAPTTYPVGDIPTLIFRTVQAGHSPTATFAATEVSPPATPMPVLPGTVYETQPASTDVSLSPVPSPSSQPSVTSAIDLSATATRRPTRTPTITPTPTLPDAGVQIADPGPMSRVVSPMHLVANLHSTPLGSYHVEIWAEPLQPGGEPRKLFADVRDLISNPVEWLFLEQDIKFELTRVADLGQLRIGVFDKYDRPVSINSVDLILLSMGASDITPSSWHTEPIVIQKPTPNQLIQGGTVTVSGLVRPDQGTLLVELVTADRLIVGYRQVFITPSADGSYVPYSIEVPYQVTSPTWVRLTISESGLRIRGVEHLSSVEVFLSP